VTGAPLRFGLVGTGYWADVAHAAGIASHPRAELVAVWGRDAAKAETLASRHGARAVGDVDRLIESVDAVAFSVPPDVQAELAVRAAEAGRALLLEKPVALTVAAAERIVEAARAPTAVFFTWRFDPVVADWYRANVDGRRWDGASVLHLSSIFEPGNPFGASPWRRERGALWDVGPHALAALLPTLGAVGQVEAVRGPRAEVHLALRHASGAASSVSLSLTAPAGIGETVFWGESGAVRMPQGRDVTAAYRGAIDALIHGETPFDARLGLEVVRVLAAAEEQLASLPARDGVRGRIAGLRGAGRWDEAVELAGDDLLLRADLLNEQALFAGSQGARAAAARELDRAEARLEAERGRLLHAAFLADRSTEDPREMAHFAASLAAAQRSGDAVLEGWARFWIGLVHQVVRGDHAAALPDLEAAYAAGRDDTMLRSYAVRHLGFAWDAEGRHDEARNAFVESVELRRADGFLPGVAAGLMTLAEFAHERGRPDEARRLLAEARETAERCGADVFLALIDALAAELERGSGA
jgi:predicted dehydrogenase